MNLRNFVATYQNEKRSIQRAIQSLPPQTDPILLAALEDICPGYVEEQENSLSQMLHVFAKRPNNKENEKQLLALCHNYHPLTSQLPTLIYTALVLFQTAVPREFRNWQQELTPPFPSHLTTTVIQENRIEYASFLWLLRHHIYNSMSGRRINKDSVKQVVRCAQNIIDLEMR